MGSLPLFNGVPFSDDLILLDAIFGIKLPHALVNGSVEKVGTPLHKMLTFWHLTLHSV